MPNRWPLAEAEDKYGSYLLGVVDQSADAVYVRRNSGKIIYANQALCDLSGYSRAELTGIYVQKLYATTESGFSDLPAASNDTVLIRGQHQLKRKDGRLLTVEVNSKIIDRDRVGAVIHDVSKPVALATQLRSVEQLLSIMETDANDALFHLSVEPGEQYRFRYVNAVFCRITATEAQKVLGKLLQEILPQPALSAVLANYRRAIRDQRRVKWDQLSILSAEEKHMEVSITPVFNAHGECTELIGLMHDITERKQHELAMERQKKLYKMLSQVNQAIVHLRDRDELFATVCRIAVQNGELQFAAIVLQDPKTRHMRITTQYGLDGSYMQYALKLANTSEVSARGVVGQVLHTGQYEVCNDYLNDPRTKPWWELARKAGIRASAVFPIREHGQVIGVLGLYASTSGYFAEDLIPTLTEIAGDVSFALDNYLHAAERARLTLERDQVFARVADGFLAVDHDWNLTYLNTAACEILHGELANLLGTYFWNAVPVEVARQLRQGFHISMVLQQRAVMEEYFDVWKRWYAVHTYPSQNGLTIYMRDITAHKRLREQDEAHRQEIGRFSQRLIEVQESERRNLARELHDEVGQCLSAINIKLKHAAELTRGETVKQALDDASGIISELDNQIGQLSLDLHPSVLDDLGLRAAFKWCIRSRFGSRREKITLDIQPQLPRFSSNVEITVFRVFQESLSNAFKYADATHIQISLAKELDQLRLVVSDNGRGFDIAAAMQAARDGKSLGLLGMQERAKILDGEVSIHSEPGHGTTVQLYLPVAGR